MDIDHLLSDEFVSFSAEVARLHAQKKRIKQDLKSYYEKVQGELAEIDDQVASLAEEFEGWKTSTVEALSVKTEAKEGEKNEPSN